MTVPSLVGGFPSRRPGPRCVQCRPAPVDRIQNATVPTAGGVNAAAGLGDAAGAVREQGVVVAGTIAGPASAAGKRGVVRRVPSYRRRWCPCLRRISNGRLGPRFQRARSLSVARL